MYWVYYYWVFVDYNFKLKDTILKGEGNLTYWAYLFGILLSLTQPPPPYILTEVIYMNDNKKPSYKFEILKLLILGFKDASHPSFVTNFNCGQKKSCLG